jgi:sec-independent protein translocase protein TatA
VVNFVVSNVAIVGWEWIVILAILVVIMIWGPDKIPKLARALGMARKEFEKAQREFTNPTPELEPASTADPKLASDDYLIQTAKSLGIETAGKTREQISKEILARAGATQPQTTTQPQSTTQPRSGEQ